jgi:16S rRNA (guanine527-N7)-methyltransferase
MQYISKYFPNLTDEQKSQFERMMEFYHQKNQNLNLISRKDIDNLELHHILHSLSIAKIIQFEPGTKVLDVGTGGGFPGIPLAVLFPECRFTLVDSIRKKVNAVGEAVEYLQLGNVRTKWTRVEDLQGKFDFVVSRAVTRLDVFRGWVLPLINKKGNNSLENGILYLKGGDIREEVSSIGVTTHFMALNKHFSETFFTEKGIVYIPA